MFLILCLMNDTRRDLTCTKNTLEADDHPIAAVVTLRSDKTNGPRMYPVAIVKRNPPIKPIVLKKYLNIRLCLQQLEYAQVIHETVGCFKFRSFLPFDMSLSTPRNSDFFFVITSPRKSKYVI